MSAECIFFVGALTLALVLFFCAISGGETF
jgi:hypothetical protein